MPASAETLRTHLGYTSWATNRLLAAAASIPAEELSRDFATADKSVLGTLVHTFAADRIWLARVRGTPPVGFVDPKEHDMAILVPAWAEVAAGWNEWAAPLSDESMLATVSYRDIKGNPWTTPLWQIVLHVVNHGTHHRGQVSGFLRSMGHPPPPLDLIAFYRELG